MEQCLPSSKVLFGERNKSNNSISWGTPDKRIEVPIVGLGELANLPVSSSYILSHGALAKFEDREAFDNLPAFEKDVSSGRFPEGCAVAYHKGVLCGISHSARGLYGVAQYYYGKTNLAVFKKLPSGLVRKLGEF